MDGEASPGSRGRGSVPGGAEHGPGRAPSLSDPLPSPAACALARVYGVEGDLSEVARRGSGSACRSLYGGFVEWQMGQRADGKDSIAQQVAPESHWPELRVLILVVSGGPHLRPCAPPAPRAAGPTSSLPAGERREEADGQHGGHADQRGDERPAQGQWQWELPRAGGWPPPLARGRGAHGAPALQFRAKALVPARMAEMARCIRERDFQAFGQLTMKDSNQFHATCLDTFPPISYLSDTSQRVIRLVHRFNAHHGCTKAGGGLRRGLPRLEAPPTGPRGWG